MQSKISTALSLSKLQLLEVSSGFDECLPNVHHKDKLHIYHFHNINVFTYKIDFSC